MEYDLDEINKAAEWFLLQMTGKTVFLFEGEMGAGKTTFIQEVCRQLKITDNSSSPTFSIINEYNTRKGEKIFHIDLYRVKNRQEAFDAGVEDCIYSGSVCFVEWPSRTPDIFPDESVNVRLEVIGEQRRRLSLAFN